MTELSGMSETEDVPHLMSLLYDRLEKAGWTRHGANHLPNEWDNPASGSFLRIHHVHRTTEVWRFDNGKDTECTAMSSHSWDGNPLGFRSWLAGVADDCGV